ncbi:MULTISPECIES: hypothetical protein [unclassified Lentimonas]|uniref:hypothetical protein n=1 Tax=unclassified Lentimonas TaxID=2630993 RepID=UPI0013277A63|nr:MULTISPECIES: hypothetical protein [unclassified Lentimonas]CAA6696229.1 Unannotated [Lentimonas sp. CC10]CAA6697513.1 Unannotated [Lentimonas sp. CC19]CAA7071240.1 Unannotated [Lentimonas sp. CC11]
MLKLNLHLCVFYVAHILFYAELLHKLLGRGELRVAGMQGQDLALIGVLGYSFFFVSGFQAILNSTWSRAYLAFLAVFTVYGVLQGNELGWIRTDLRTWLWLYGGIALFLMLQSSRRPVWHLAIIFIALTGMANLGKQQAISAFGNLVAGQDRFYNLNLMEVSTIFLVYLGLLLNFFDGFKQAKWLTIPVVTTFLYYGIYICATRNIMLSFIVLMTLSIYREYIKGEGVNLARLAGFGITGLVALLLILSSPAGQRFLNGDKQDKKSTSTRWEEVVNVSQEFQPVELLFGKGMGTTFQNAINPGNYALHLGVFNLYFKFGLLALVGFTVIVCLYLPVSFMLSRGINDALLRALPYCFSWLVIFCISGGYHTNYMLGIGMSLAFLTTLRKESQLVS